MAEIINKLADAQKNGLLTEEFWDNRLLEIISLKKKDFVFMSLGDTVKLPQNQGTTKITYRRYLPLPVNLAKHQLTEGVAPEAMKMEGIKVSGTVKQYGAYLKITDVADIVHFDKLLNVYQPDLARHALEVQERVILESFAEASDHFVGGVTAVEDIPAGETGVLKFSTLREISMTMEVNKREGHQSCGGDYVVVVGPQVGQDLLDDDVVLQRMLLTGQENSPIRNASLSGYKVYNFHVKTSRLLAEPVIATPTAGDAFNVFRSVVLGKRGYQFIELVNIKWYETGFTASKEDPLAQTATYGYKGFFGAKVIDPMTVFNVYSRSVNFDQVADPADPYTRTATQDWA